MSSLKYRRLRFMLCVILLGGFWRLYERYVWMSFRGFSIVVDEPEIERRFWDVLPERYIRFWPLFIRGSLEVGDFLEKTLPVFVRTRMTGFGSFATDIKLLSPWLLVEWRNAIWCVAKEGRMWNVGDENIKVRGMEIPKKPLWKISSGSEELSLPGGVFPLIFSTDAIENFLLKFGDSPWFGYVSEIVVDHRVGTELFKLVLIRGRQEFHILIQEGKYEARDITIALEDVLEELFKEGGNYYVDATYNNKIVVSDLPLSGTIGVSR
ncbi:hypothetical protein FACS1894187_00090 [Synergistales bacterium]|nr:hypothetical protein FACS1894187_00090 [Synergistales bacterium]